MYQHKRFGIVAIIVVVVICHDASVVNASGTCQVQANITVAGQRLSPGNSTRWAVTTMGSDDLVVGEDHIVGPSRQRRDWQVTLDGLCQLT